jgi:bifunctional ADP-heptose synthase (sugar kinase/adenylyltransferase)
MDIQQAKSFKILVIGDSCTDFYYFGNCERLSPEAPVPVFQLLRTEKKKGMASNVIANLKGLGNQVDSVINEQDINKKRYIDERTKQHLLRVDEGDHELIEPITDEQVDNIDFNKYDALVISDYDKGFLPPRKIKSILKKASDCPIFVDSKKEDLSIFRNCIMKINKKEFVCSESLPKFSNLIITLGKDGAMWFNEKKKFPTEEVEVFDVCGAGDTFLAALTTAYLSCKDMEESIEFANECATYSVCQLGVYAIKREDLV